MKFFIFGWMSLFAMHGAHASGNWMGIELQGEIRCPQAEMTQITGMRLIRERTRSEMEFYSLDLTGYRIDTDPYYAMVELKHAQRGIHIDLGTPRVDPVCSNRTNTVRLRPRTGVVFQLVQTPNKEDRCRATGAGSVIASTARVRIGGEASDILIPVLGQPLLIYATRIQCEYARLRAQPVMTTLYR